MKAFDAARDVVKLLRDHDSNITPYLGLRSRLSQVWLNRWTILLLLVLVRTLFAISSLDDSIGDAKREALASCSAVESMGTAMASMPHYMAQGANELTVHGVQSAIDGLMSMLSMSVTVVEELVVFMINLLTSTYVCLITLVVAGSLHVAIQVIEDVSNFVNKTIGDIGRDIHSGISDFESGMNKFIGDMDKIPKAFGSNSQIPTLNINASLDALDHLQLPSGLDEGLDKLNNSIPTFSQVNNFTNNAIRIPFEDLKRIINGSNHNYTIDKSLFPIPVKDTVSFCSSNDGISRFFQGLYKIVTLSRRIAIAVLVILATVLCIPMAIWEVYRWRSMQARAELIDVNAYDPLDVVYIASRPYSATVGIKLAQTAHTRRRKALVRWVVAYTTTTPALFVLSLGAAGLFGCLCHYILLKAIVKEVPALTHMVDNFADQVVNKLTSASVKWANGTNEAILGVNNKINLDVFSWVNTSTSAMNDTLRVFSNEMTDALNATFGGTVLYGPITEVFNCLIGLKITGMERGLTWIQEHAHVDFPLLPNNTFSVGAAASITNGTNAQSFLADPQQGTTDQVSAAVYMLEQRIERSIRKEAIISGVLVGAYVLLVLIGLIRALVLYFGDDNAINQGHITDGRPKAGFYSAEKQVDVLSLAPKLQQRNIQSPAPPYSNTTRIHNDTADDVAENPDQDADSWNGTAYTLKPRPLPTFVAVVSPPGAEVDVSGTQLEEKYGFAGQRPIDTHGVAPQRTSSYADMSVASHSTMSSTRMTVPKA